MYQIKKAYIIMNILLSYEAYSFCQETERGGCKRLVIMK